MVVLSDEDKEKIVNEEIPEMVINGKLYFVKRAYELGWEQVGEQIAKEVGITCAHYELVHLDNRYYYLSESLSNENTEFIPAAYAGCNSNSLFDIWYFLEKTNNEQQAIIMNKVIKVFLLDALLRPGDRHLANWGFLMQNDNIKDVCVLDNELIMNEDYNSLYVTDINIGDEGVFVDLEFRDAIKELKSFFDMSDASYKEAFKNMYDYLTPQHIIDIINQIEINNNIKIPDKAKAIKVYQDNYNQVGRILNERSR